MKFAHLHCRSYYSMLRGTASLERLVPAARRAGMDSLALTDVGGLYGWVEFVKLCRDHGIRPLCGVELRASDASAVLLARDPKGYERICRLTSDFHLEEGFSLGAALREDRDHLSVLSRDTALLEGLRRETGPKDLYVEIVPLTETLPLLRFAAEQGLKPVASNDVHFLDPRESILHRMLRAIAGNTKLSRLDPSDCAEPERFFCDAEWMAQKLSHAPEAIANAARLSRELYSDWRLGETVFPPFSEFSATEAFFTLRWKCHQGARRRYGALSEKVKARLEYELGVIRQKGFTHYFLVVEDIVKQAPRTCGRGSVAASLVSYCLGITHVDPIALDLFFERFLNPGRTDPPDADIDFPWDERERIFDYIFDKYGPYRAACVANHVRLQPQASIREVAKVLGLPDDEITRATEKLLRFPPKKFPEPWDRILPWARCLADFPRYLSVHAGGVVIVPDDLRRYVPLQRAAKGVNILQWEKDQTEDFGLVKIDILGNRSLAVVRDALESVERNTGESLSYDRFDPAEDAATQAMIAQGDTMGVFYIESPATRQLQQKARVGDYPHLVIHSSIIRPASNRYINEYVQRLHGKPYSSLHPLLDGLLDETFGIMVYQEDVTKAAMAVAGFDAIEGDGLRKALTKKRPGKLLGEYRERFVAGALERGATLAQVDAIWEMMMSFAGYSFCKPHSASYARVSYQSAYLRAHHPAEFMAAVISNGGGFYSTFAYLSEARRMGLEILGPDVNASEIPYLGNGKRLRIGLMQLQGLRRDSQETLILERARGKYLSLADLLARVDLPLSDLKILLRSGSLDSLEPERNRPQMMWQLLQSRGDSGSKDEFRWEASRQAWIPDIEDYLEAEKLFDERETLGLVYRFHPLRLYESVLGQVDCVPSRELKNHVGKKVRMAGWWITGKVVSTKRGEAMEFMSFEDMTGIYETTFFPRSYRRNVPKLNARQPFLLMGRVADELGAISLNVDDVTAVSLPAESIAVPSLIRQ
ncbi:MAG: DNA polymerase III subunit alpha [Deltaproteobacteria bacterium]|nr:DNA polymerase III subunit alpha [Deltaproteobacteria bacterium]